MQPMRWWQFGLIGGATLSIATAAKAVGAVVIGPGLAGVRLADAAGFAAAIFGVGFVCGAVAWAARGLSRQFGPAGDGAVGLVVMVIFFACCMLAFDPPMLADKFVPHGLLMMGLAAVLGPIGGVMVGRDLRRDFAAGGGPAAPAADDPAVGAGSGDRPCHAQRAV
jgi:hypothetical protein